MLLFETADKQGLAVVANGQHADLNKLIGERIHRLMRQQWITHEQLADFLDVTRPQISKRLSGAVKWSAVEVAVTAAWLRVPIADIIPPLDDEHPVEPISVLVPIDELRHLPEGSVLVVTAPSKEQPATRTQPRTVDPLTDGHANGDGFKKRSVS